MKAAVLRVWGVAALTVALGLVFFAASVFAHGGHGKPEAQFKVMPKAINDPGKPLVKMGDISISRQDFFDYIRNVGAFQMKVDLLQRDFLLHYWVVEGVSRYYPTDINELMPRLIEMSKVEPEEFQSRIFEWANDQAGLYARLKFYTERARKNERHNDPAVVAILDCFTKHVKAGFLEEIVGLGSMTPTHAGLAEWVAGLTAEQKADITALYPDPDSIKGTKRSQARKRWIQYRRDLMDDTGNERTFEKVTSLKNPDSVIAKVNKHQIKVSDFLAIYGPVINDVNWNNLKKSRGSQMMLVYAAADEIDRLGILSQRSKAKIEQTNQLYLAADQMVRDFGPKVSPVSGTIDFEYFREIARYQNLIKFEKVFLAASEKLPAFGSLWVDTDYLKSVDWTVETAYTPKQSKFF
jgi:hypothetical protein